MFLEDRIYDFEYQGTKYYYIRKSEANTIKVEKDKFGKDRFIGVYKCTRCGGEGQSNWRPHNGICYECKGIGHTTVILDTTKNISTAERRLQASKDKKEAEKNEAQKQLLERNLQNTQNLYGDEFYLILDTLEYSTYKSKEYLKSKGARWNPDWTCWWTKSTDTVAEDFKDFQLYKIPVKEVINEYNRIKNDGIRTAVYKYRDWLESKRGVVVYEKVGG